MSSYLLWTLCFLVCLQCAYSAQCNKYECPDYKVLEKGDDYEIRFYFPSKFAVTSVEGKGFYQASGVLHKRLSNYMKGKNNQKQQIPMTSPVIRMISVKDGILTDEGCAMMFYLPNKFQENPPMPTNKEVHILNQSGHKFIVRSFEGAPLKSNVVYQQKMLKKRLDQLGLKYDHAEFLAVTYNGPTEIVGKQNEVMYILE